MSGSVEIEQLEGPRSARGLIADAFRLYRRFPLLFLALAAAVLVPYDLIVLAFTGAGPVSRRDLAPGTEAILLAIDLLLITALISALTVHAVAHIRDGSKPRLSAIAITGLRVLPVVVAATIIADLGMFVGFFLLVIPGVIAFLRLCVVPQAAAIEHEGWIPALRSSWALTEFRSRHLLAFFALMLLIVFAAYFLMALPFADDAATTPVSFVGGAVAQTLISSFAGLATALLYYDLRLRREQLAAEAPVRVSGLERGRPAGEDPGPSGPSTVAPDAKQSSWDPRVYTDPERPSGWYVVPSRPHRMRYWMAGEEPAWHPQSARTPKTMREEWEREVGLRGPAA